MSDPSKKESDYSALFSTYSFADSYQPLSLEKVKSAISSLKQGQIGTYFDVQFYAPPVFKVCACGHYEENHAPEGQCIVCMPNCVSFAEDNLDWLIRREEYQARHK